MKFSAAFITLIAGTAASVVPRAVQDVYSLAELDSIIKGNPKVSTNFCAQWSSVCLHREYEALSAKFNNVVFVNVDIDIVGTEEAIEKYKFSAIPTFITFEGGEEFGNRVIGPAPAAVEQQVQRLSNS